jgi:hypothetical protein
MVDTESPGLMTRSPKVSSPSPSNGRRSGELGTSSFSLTILVYPWKLVPLSAGLALSDSSSSSSGDLVRLNESGSLSLSDASPCCSSPCAPSPFLRSEVVAMSCLSVPTPSFPSGELIGLVLPFASLHKISNVSESTVFLAFSLYAELAQHRRGEQAEVSSMRHRDLLQDGDDGIGTVEELEVS